MVGLVTSAGPYSRLFANPSPPAPGTYLYGRNADYDAGPITHYADLSKTASGAGTLGDPLSRTQAAALGNGGASKIHCRLIGGNHVLPTTNLNYVPAFSPLNSGSSTNRIVFSGAADVNDTVNRTQISTTAPSVGANGCPAFGAESVDYVIFDRIYVDGATAHYQTDTGHYHSSGTLNCEVHRSWIHGEVLVNAVDNYCGIRLNNTVGTVMKNMKIDNMRASGGPFQSSHNICALQTYIARDYYLDQFYFFNSNCGIYIKGTAGGMFNWGTACNGIIENCNTAIREQGMDPTNRSYAHHILMFDCDTGAPEHADTGTPSDTQNIDYEYFTFARQSPSAPNASDQGNANFYGGTTMATTRFRYNIITETNLSQTRVNRMFSAPQAIDYNRYYNGAGSVRAEFNSVLYDNDLSGWRTATGGEANSSYGDPLFTNSPGGVFTLQGGSPCLTMGPGGTQIGAYGPGGSGTLGVQTY